MKTKEELVEVFKVLVEELPILEKGNNWYVYNLCNSLICVILWTLDEDAPETANTEEAKRIFQNLINEAKAAHGK